MLKSITVIFGLVAIASSGLVVPQPKISCDECTREMHALAAVIRQFAPEMEEFLKAEYCPAAAAEDEHLTIDRCTQDLADSYPTMLQLVVQHFFNDGALHICQVAGVCDVRSQLLANPKQPRPFTCNECVEGLQFVEAYMNDPLWVNEYTLYLELNFCASHQPPHCPDMVKRHFPAMHAMAMEEFFVPESLCGMYAVCGGTATVPPHPHPQ